MIIFVFIIAAVILYGIKPAEKNQYYDACSHRQTSMINGIFTMLCMKFKIENKISNFSQSTYSAYTFCKEFR